jgi:hypothetical protein
VILQVLSHAGEIQADIDPPLLEFALWSDSGKHQQLR